MSGKAKSSGVSRSAGGEGGGDGRGDRGDSEPKTKKQRLIAAGSDQNTETEEELYQKAVALVFGGQLYFKLLQYAGRDGIRHLRGDRHWRKAMDELPADDLRQLKLPAVPRPSDIDLSLLRSLLTVKTSAGDGCSGWTLNDLGWEVLVSSPLTSYRVYEDIIKPDLDNRRLEMIANDYDAPAGALKKMVRRGTSEILLSIASHRNATSEILSAVLLRVLHRHSNFSSGSVVKITECVAHHKNTCELDLMLLADDTDKVVRAAVGKNENTPGEVLRDLSSDESSLVRYKVARNRSTPQDVLVALSVDEDEYLRAGVAENSASDLELLWNLSADPSRKVLSGLTMNWSSSKELQTFLATSYPKHLLDYYATRFGVSDKQMFSLKDKNHREFLVTWSQDPDVLASLVGMDEGIHDKNIARSRRTPPHALDTLSHSSDKRVRCLVAANKKTSIATLERLFRDEACKIGLSRNSNVPVAILESLAEHEDVEIRKNVAVNESTTLEILRKMLEKETDDGVLHYKFNWLKSISMKPVPYPKGLSQLFGNEWMATQKTLI